MHDLPAHLVFMPRVTIGSLMLLVLRAGRGSLTHAVDVDVCTMCERANTCMCVCVYIAIWVKSVASVVGAGSPTALEGARPGVFRMIAARVDAGALLRTLSATEMVSSLRDVPVFQDLPEAVKASGATQAGANAT